MKPVARLDRLMQLLALALGSLLLTLAAAPVLAADRPNILLITTDEHRWDALGVAGNAVIQTPNLDRLAREGFLFTRTYTQGPLCQPARASLLTGRYVHEHGQTWNRSDMDPKWATFPRALQAAGYRTAIVGKTHFYDPPRAMRDLRDQVDVVRSFGFDYALEEIDKYVHLWPGVTTPYTEYLERLGLLATYRKEIPEIVGGAADMRGQYEGRSSSLPPDSSLDSFIADRAIDLIRGHDGDQPLFLWVSFVGPHPPIIAPDPKWVDRYRDAEIPLGPGEPPVLYDDACGAYLRTWIQSTKSAGLTADERQLMGRAYYAMVSQIDERVGDILAALDKKGIADDTWILFTADHGEMLGDHSMMFKNVFYKGSVLVPAIVHPPVGFTPRTVADLTEHIDLTATILDVARAAPLPGQRGRSLVPVMRGELPGRGVVWSELAGHRNQGNFLVMARNERYRYVWDRDNELACELFDLEHDPDELHNLARDPAAAEARDRLQRELVEPFLRGELGG